MCDWPGNTGPAPYALSLGQAATPQTHTQMHTYRDIYAHIPYPRKVTGSKPEKRSRKWPSGVHTMRKVKHWRWCFAWKGWLCFTSARVKWVYISHIVGSDHVRAKKWMVSLQHHQLRFQVQCLKMFSLLTTQSKQWRRLISQWNKGKKRDPSLSVDLDQTPPNSRKQIEKYIFSYLAQLCLVI